jgi:hypothetical protein
MAMMDDRQGMMHMPMMKLHGRIEGWLAFLRAELAVTDAQSGAWESFASAVRTAVPPSGHQSHHPKGKPKHQSSASMMQKPWPEHAKAHLEMMETHLASMRRIHAAAEPLYDSLSGDQKRKADELLPLVLMHIAHGGGDHDP